MAETASATTEEVLATFTASLDRLDVTWGRCAPEEFLEVLAEEVEAPAVGVALPFEELAPEERALESASLTLDPLPGELRAARTGVTAAVLGIADYGSIAVQHGEGVEAVSLFPERHVAVLRTSDVVPSMASGLKRLGPALRNDRRSVVIATGPSATADMGELVKGAHGPREVHVILLDVPNENG